MAEVPHRGRAVRVGAEAHADEAGQAAWGQPYRAAALAVAGRGDGVAGRKLERLARLSRQTSVRNLEDDASDTYA